MDDLCGFEDVIQTYKRQHYKIQNLQKTNIFLKTKIKELDENKAHSA
jgi:cell division protein FtsB